MLKLFFPASLLAIDIGGSKLIVATCRVEQNNETGELFLTFLRESRCSLAPTMTIEQLLEQIDCAASDLLKAEPFEYQAIGVTIPGLADPKTGEWIYACFSGIRNVPIAKILGAKYGSLVAIENDVNACALAEKYFGSCRQTNDFLWVTVSNGVGGGLMLRGEIFGGAFGNAGEIGHFCVEEKESAAIRCGCGNMGCLEAQIAGPGTSKRYHALTGISKTAAEIASLARQGDNNALLVYQKNGYYLGKAIAASVNLLNLEKVIIGGGISASFDLFYAELEKTFQDQVFRDANKNVIIEPTQLGYSAALAGAAALGYRRIVKSFPL
jgi:glucokinase